jgi:hypothetical protein
MPVSGGQYYTPEDVYNGFRALGLPHEQAAPFAGVLSKEGGVAGKVYTGSFGGQPTERGGALNPGGAYGLAQFNGSRQQDLLNFAQQRGAEPSHLPTQLAFIVQDAKNRGIDMSSAADIVNRYEVPAQQYRAGEIAGAQQVAARFNPNAAPSSLAQAFDPNAQQPAGAPAPGGAPSQPAAPVPSTLADALQPAGSVNLGYLAPPPPSPIAQTFAAVGDDAKKQQQAQVDADQKRRVALLGAGNTALAHMFATG